MKPSKTRVSGGSIGALGFSAGLQFNREVEETKSFQYKLTRLCRALTAQGHGVLILVDEVQANLPEMRQLVSAYQEIVGERLNIAIAMAGLPGAISATLNERALTFLNRARKIELGPLPIREVEAYFTLSFAQLNLSISSEQCSCAAKEAAASPYLMQLIGYNITLLASDDGAVDERLLKKALENVRIDFENDVCSTTLSSLSDRDREFLMAMAQDEGESAISDIASRMGVSNDYARKYRARLIDAGVIETSRRAHVVFAVPYLAQYLRHIAV